MKRYKNNKRFIISSELIFKKIFEGFSMVEFDFESVMDGDAHINPLDMELLSREAGGYISANKNIFNNLKPLSDNARTILKESVKGTPMIKIGNGYPRLMIVAGIHGNELAPQIASLKLIDVLLKLKLRGTVYIIPFACPYASMMSNRYFKGTDLNRTAHIQNSISNVILSKARELGVSAIGDFHSTAPNTNPGKEGVFCSKSPTVESVSIASYISRSAGSNMIVYPAAGVPFKGAVEDEANLGGIPSVTCEVLSATSFANERICNRALVQMKSFLHYFGIFDEYMV